MYDLGIIGSAVRLDGRPYFTTLDQIEGRTQTSMAQVQRYMVRALGTYGAYRLFKEAAQAAMDFGAELSNISSIAENMDMSKVKRDILDINSQLGKSKDLAFSFYYAFSSGMRGSEKELTKFTADMARMAKTIRAEAVPAMDSATTLMNAYKLSTRDAARVSDWFYTNVKYGKTTGQELATTLGLVADSAAIAGVPLNELGAAIATLTKTMPTTRAVTALNQVIMSFLDPSKEAKEVAASLGIELSAAAIKSKGFANVLGEISEKAGDNSEALALMFGNVRAFRAAASLAGTQAETFRDILGEFENNAGSSLRAFDRQVKNTKVTWEAAMVDMSKAMITLGDSIAPVVELTAGIISGTSKMVTAVGGGVTIMSAAGAITLVYRKELMSLVRGTISYMQELRQMPGAIVSMSSSMQGSTATLTGNTAALNANNAAMARAVSLRSGGVNWEVGQLLRNAAISEAPTNMKLALFRGQVGRQTQMNVNAFGKGVSSQPHRFNKDFFTTISALPAASTKAASKLALLKGGLAQIGVTSAGSAIGVAGLIGVVGTLGYKLGEWIGSSTGMHDVLSGMRDAERELERVRRKELLLTPKYIATYYKRLDMLKAENKISKEAFNRLNSAGYSKKNYGELSDIMREGERLDKDPIARGQARLQKYFTASWRTLDDWSAESAASLNKLKESLWNDDGQFSTSDKIKLIDQQLEDATERLKKLSQMADLGSRKAIEARYKELEEQRKLIDQKRQLRRQAMNEEIRDNRAAYMRRVNSMRSHYIMNDGSLDSGERYYINQEKIRAQRKVIADIEERYAKEKDDKILAMLRQRRDQEVEIYGRLMQEKENLDPKQKFASTQNKYIDTILAGSGGKYTKEAMDKILKNSTQEQQKLYKSLMKKYEHGNNYQDNDKARRLASGEFVAELKRQNKIQQSQADKLAKTLDSLLKVMKDGQKGGTVVITG
jgi:TP901 family phage tail tape measure protein